MERLYKKLENYGKSDFYPFHMPGHKRNKACIEGDFPVERDITEIDGFDDLHHSEGILLEAQKALSRLYGTRASFFSVNGSTAGLLTAISACVKKGGQILVARNCHKAVYHAIYLRELVPTYIYPQSDPKLGINGEISASRVERCLEANPEVFCGSSVSQHLLPDQLPNPENNQKTENVLHAPHLQSTEFHVYVQFPQFFVHLKHLHRK